MCDPVSDGDSRGGGVYCCRCNRWRAHLLEACPACGRRHRGALEAAADRIKDVPTVAWNDCHPWTGEPL